MNQLNKIKLTCKFVMYYYPNSEDVYDNFIIQEIYYLLYFLEKDNIDFNNDNYWKVIRNLYYLKKNNSIKFSEIIEQNMIKIIELKIHENFKFYDDIINLLSHLEDNKN